MERSLSMEIVRVTEAAAMASARWMGRGEKEEADNAQRRPCERYLIQFQ